MDLDMSHIEQKELIKITTHKSGMLPKNVPVVDQYLNNYRQHKTAGAMGSDKLDKSTQSVSILNDIYIVEPKRFKSIH